MANTKSAKKQHILSEKHRKFNASRRSMMRTHMKRVISAVNDENFELAQNEFVLAQKIIDKNEQKGIIHKNTAARYKSRLHRMLKKLEEPKIEAR